MKSLVESPEQVAENIRRFNGAVSQFRDLLPYGRAWYAIKSEGRWLLAPSKFIGYINMTPKEYLESHYEKSEHGRVNKQRREVMDGRVTERALGQWSSLIEKGHPLYDEIHSELVRLCSQFGKRPNSLSRISILNAGPGPSETDLDDNLVRLLAAVFEMLSPAQKTEFRKLTA